MTNTKETVPYDKDSQEGKFTLLCDYADIVSSKSIIVSDDTGEQFFLYGVIEPFPTCEEYSLGEEFEEGDLLSVHNSWTEAKKSQNLRKP